MSRLYPLSLWRANCFLLSPKKTFIMHSMLTKHDLQQIKRVFREVLDEKTFSLERKLDRIEVKLDLMNEGILDVMVLTKMHQTKIRELEKLLSKYAEGTSS